MLCPTRELANQIEAVVAPLAQALGLRTTTIFGGVSQHRQVTALDAGVDILVACPGRLEDLLNQKLLSLDGIEITVLDEADHMADLGFLPGVRRIMDRTPKQGQRLLFSATLDNGVDQLVQRFLTKPVQHSVDPAESPVVAMTHHVLEVADADAKRDVVHHLASGRGRRVLFTRTKHQAKKLAKQLTTAGIPAVDLHGNLSQNARERNLEAFSGGDVRVLVATDIAARGIHVDEIELVVHVDPPAEHKAYLHRSGRTARAGSGGDVVTLMLPEQRQDVRLLTRAAKIDVRPVAVAPGDARLDALVGAVAAFVAPSASPLRQSAVTSGSGTGAPGGRSGRGGRGGAGRSSRPAAAAPGQRTGGRAHAVGGTSPVVATTGGRTVSGSGTASAAGSPGSSGTRAAGNGEATAGRRRRRGGAGRRRATQG